MRSELTRAEPGGIGDRLMDWEEVSRFVPYSRFHVWRLEGYTPPAFPLRVQVGPNRIAWWESEILEWLRSRPRSARRRAA